MQELLRRDLADGALTVVATERRDGDVHPQRTAAAALRRRQHALTGRAWTMVEQVHGVDVHLVAPGDRAWRPTVARADVLVAGRGPTIAVWVADCAPVVLVADDGTIVGAHCGWRGLAAGILDIAVAALGGRRPAGAVIGPSIHACCYEFGAADVDRVAAGMGLGSADVRGRTAAGAVALDAPGAIVAALAQRGIAVDVVGECTGCTRRYYSHRVRAESRRHAVVAWVEQR